MKIRIVYTPDAYKNKKYINRLNIAYHKTAKCPYCNSNDIKKRYELNNFNSYIDNIFVRCNHIIFCTCRDCGTHYSISFKTPSEVGNLKPYFNILEREEL